MFARTGAATEDKPATELVASTNPAISKKRLVGGIRAYGRSERNSEQPISMAIHAPGQRGIVQVLVRGKRDLVRTKPSLQRVQDASRVIKKQHTRQLTLRAKLSQQIHKVLAYGQACIADWSEQRLEGTTRPLVPDPVAVLTKMVDGVKAIEKGHEKEKRKLAEIERPLELALEQSVELVETLKQQIDHQTSIGAAFMKTKFTKDSATAVGRGPPGHIAFSPFTAYDPLFERAHVEQTIVESTRRTNGPASLTTAGGGRAAAKRRAATSATVPT